MPFTATAVALPRVTLIVAAHDEEAVIERTVENALALDYPRERLEVIVASDGSADRTVELARARPREREPAREACSTCRGAGKVRAQDAAVDEAHGEVLAFSDANALWEPDALRLLVETARGPGVGYVCGGCGTWRRTAQPGGRVLAIRDRRPRRSRPARFDHGGQRRHVRGAARGLSAARPAHQSRPLVPFNLVKRGWRAVYEPLARAVERPLPRIEGEFRRKRRMMSHAWPTVLRGGMLDPRGYGLAVRAQIYSHRRAALCDAVAARDRARHERRAARRRDIYA